MAKLFSLPTICLLLLCLGFANSARLLEQVGPMFTPADELPALPPADDSSTATLLPSGQAPAAGTEAPAAAADQAPADDDIPTPDVQPDQPTTTPAAAAPEEATPAAAAPEEGTSAAPLSAGPAQGGAAAASGAEHPGHPAISFFMHDVLGGSSASGRIVTGLIATSDMNGIPFSRPNNQVFPVTNGVPLMNNGNLNNVLNNNNVPFLAGLTGQNQPQAQTIIQNAGTNSVVNGGDNNQAFVTPGQLPTGTTLQKLLFGSITVIDDELTEGHELGSGVIGRGQGFYLASSLDGESHTMAFTAVFHGGEHEQVADDTISFFGVHRTASPISQIAIIGGTGKYENAKGYATIETMPDQNQHTTDGVDTVAHFSVYLY
ncbi:hypothetical protein BVRB_2g046060 [Beta vulgaris subsp. vulgaris]|uniref:Dirigent protein n=1 Tax=Beta vulgaris subsp. vulgaris TaxID=3555 RepID=A0A0J8BGW6_BETVV|nr:dirigent protein 9 [Beta vulgaris subsp. vulgaris]KMS99302.1 hypothetical protein BVRB_2g046060 [Beta vulgaris subsp. vulgaris]